MQPAHVSLWLREGRAVRRRWTWWLAWGTGSLALALYVVALAIVEVVGYSVATQQDTWAARTARARRVRRVRDRRRARRLAAARNAVGWLFLGVALLVALSVLGGEYANYVFVEHPGSLPARLRRRRGSYLWTWFPALG